MTLFITIYYPLWRFIRGLELILQEIFLSGDFFEGGFNR